MAKKLTARTVEFVEPTDIRQEIPDSLLRGLYLIVQPSGVKSWAVRYRISGKSRKYTLGPYPMIDLKTARTMGAEALRSAATGKDPADEKKRAAAARDNTIDAVIDEYAQHIHRVNRKRSAIEAERMLRLHVLPFWTGRLAADVTKRDVIQVLDRLIKAGKPIAANRTLAAMKTMFRRLVDQDFLKASPCQTVKQTKEKSRDRFLSDKELAAVWKAAGRVSYPFGRAVQVLILTGARRGEVALMKWSELDFEAGSWTLPAQRTKNARAHAIALTPSLVHLLQGLPRINNSEYVFTHDGRKPAGGYSRSKARLDSLCGVKGWTLHDLRRTMASGMARLGIQLPVIERCLNHMSGSFAGIVAVYQRHSFAPEMADAFSRWTVHVKEISIQQRDQTFKAA